MRIFYHLSLQISVGILELSTRKPSRCLLKLPVEVITADGPSQILHAAVSAMQQPDRDLLLYCPLPHSLNYADGRKVI